MAVAGRRLLVTGVLVAVAATACSGGGSTPAADRTDSPTPSSTVAAFAESTTPLAPGRYSKAGFAPALSFAIAAPGWVPAQDADGFFDVERRPGTLDVIAVQFARPTGADTAGALLRRLDEQPGLTIGAPSATSIGGRPATRVIVDNTDPHLQAQRFATAFSVAAGPISVASGRRLQLDLVDTADGLLAVVVGGSVRRWQAATKAADPILASIRFESG